MELRVLGCHGGESRDHHPTAFLLDRTILLEAGTALEVLEDNELRGVRDVLVSHAHLDHVRDLPFLCDWWFLHGVRGVTVHALPEVIEDLRRHLFNDRIWPDFSRIPLKNEPVLLFRGLEPLVPRSVGHFTVTAVPVPHTVPAAGFLLSDETASIVYTGDSGPTEELWRLAGNLHDLAAVIAEASYPATEGDLAEASGHLTTGLLAGELAKLDRPGVPIYITHMKPTFTAAISRELAAMGRDGVRTLVEGRTYRFPEEHS